MDIRDYQIVIEHLSDEDGGGYLATVPELAGCMADGDTRQEALQRVEDAMQTWASLAGEMGGEVPAPLRKRAYA
ncbi:MAG TPA: type II toxin-antitoxin system HicB family antitoxin [Chthoniobacterales bacterium]|nr:type II toxin-antitoxin system HicB family antitoxin [Chthoniobacterales bacterium]